MDLIAQVTTDTTSLGQAWAGLVEFLPKAVGFLITLFVGFIIAKVLGNATAKALRRIGFDRAMERGGIRHAMASTGMEASDVVGRIVYFIVALLTLQMGFGFFGPNPISDLLTRTIAFLPNILVAVAIVVVTAYIATFVKQIIMASLGGLSYGRMLAVAASVGIVMIGVFAALDQVGVAPAIVQGLFYAMLAIIVGSAVIAIGGGGIQPMRGVWERTMQKAQDEAPKIKEHLAQNAQTERVKVVTEGPYTA